MQMINKEQVCKEYDLSKKKLNELIRRGDIPFIRLGERTTRFNPKSLDQWIQSKEIGGIR